MRLEGKVILISGGSSGIGLACARLFLEEGATVYVGDISPVDPSGAPGVTYRQLDVTDENAWTLLVADILGRQGRIDVLVNNAGTVGSYEPIDSIDVSDWDRVIAVNQRGTFLGMRSVIPAMRDAGGGAIVNVSSIWGIAGAVGVSAYTASKAAVRSMSRNAALTYVRDGIRVNSLCPGIIDTPLIAAQDADITEHVISATPMGRMGRPAEIAYGALFLASDESSFMTGADLVIDGGYTAP